MSEDTQEHHGGTQPDADMVGGFAPQGPPPGSAAPGAPMETGPDAGAGPGGPEDVDRAVVATASDRGEGGPTGSQDSGQGDLAEAGE